MPVVKLYVAETYRPNLGGALLHLDGARAAYSRLNTWLALDPNYILTLCESGESYLLPGVQPTPIAFPTIADQDLRSHIPRTALQWSTFLEMESKVTLRKPARVLESSS
jgi:hypothetical protein